jgi:hypothetical protein
MKEDTPRDMKHSIGKQKLGSRLIVYVQRPPCGGLVSWSLDNELTTLVDVVLFTLRTQ